MTEVLQYADDQADDTPRDQFIGGSDAAAVCGLSPWSTPVRVWMEKTGQAVREVFDPARERRFKRGKMLEPFIVEMGIDKLREQGHDVELLARNKRYRDREHPFLACEIDFELLLDGEHVTGDAKSVHGFARDKWGQEGTDEIPIEYAAQFLHGLGITKRKRCVVFSLCGLDDVAIYYVEYDAEVVDQLRAQCVAFWNDSVIDGVVPEAVVVDDVFRLYRTDDGNDIEATPEIARSVDAYRALKETIKDADERAEALKLEIVDFMRPHARLINPSTGKPICTWKHQVSRRMAESLLRESHPDIAREFTTENDLRVLRLSKRKATQ